MPQPTAAPTATPQPTPQPAADLQAGDNGLLASFQFSARGASSGTAKRQFQRELTLTVGYGDLGERYPRMSVAVWNPDDAAWERLPTENLEAERKLRARIPHFSVFAVLADPPLHAADVVVNGVTFNTMNNNPQAGTVDTVRKVGISRRVDHLLGDSATVSKFASDPVPTGKVWDITGANWTFDADVAVTSGATGDGYFVKAVVYKIDVNGAATALTGLLAPGGTTTINSVYPSFQRVSFTGAVPATRLYAGERYAVEWYANNDDRDQAGATFYLGYDTSSSGTGASAVTPQIIESNAPGLLREAHYRIGQDTALGSMQWYAATDTTAVDIARNASFRVRFQIFNDGNSDVTWYPVIQSSPDQTTWTTLPTSSGAAPFYVFNTSQFADGDAIATNTFALGAGTGTATAGKAYDTTNNNTRSHLLPAGTYTEIEFNLQANANAAYDGTYYFRLRNNTTNLDSYANNASIRMRSAPGTYQHHDRIGLDRALNDMGWYAGTDAPALVPRNTNFRVRFQVYNDSGAAVSLQPRLQYSTNVPTPTWVDVPTTTGAAPFFIALSSVGGYDDNTTLATANFGLGTGLGTASDGRAYESSNPGAAFSLPNNGYTELEFNVQANNNATPSENYIFRIRNNTTNLTGYKDYAEVIIKADPLPTPTTAPPAHNDHAPYAATTDACARCHRTHTAKSPQAIEKAWPQEQVCFTCHNLTGAPAPDIQSAFNKTYKMPLLTTGDKHSLAEVRTKDPALLSGANRHVQCTDCHNPHTAGKGNHTRGSAYSYGPLQGIWGVSVDYSNSASWSAPTFATTNRAGYEYEVCFKCHSSWAYGSSPPTSPSGGFAETDQSKEFSPLNASYMPVVDQGKNPFTYAVGSTSYNAGGRSYANSLLNGDGGTTNRLTPTSRITCTDCHGGDNSAADPAGPHGSNNPFILRGGWDRTTGQSTGNGGVNTSSHLCFKCHDYNMYTNRNNEGTLNQTGFSGEKQNLHAFHVGSKQNKLTNEPIVCMDCHIAVPHGYFRERLLGFTGSTGRNLPADPAPYINRPAGSGGLTTINTWASSGNWQYTNCATAMAGCKDGGTP